MNLIQSRPGITCPECDSPSRVAHTVRLEDGIERLRRCRRHGHYFKTLERPFQSAAPAGWSEGSGTVNTRNLLDRIIRERVSEDGAHFKTIERIEP